MTLINTTPLYNGLTRFTFTHKIKGETKLFQIPALNRTNADRKVKKAINKAYKDAKLVSKV
jgi:hypothetical protein